MSASTRRSDELKKLLATSIQTASDTPSDVTIIGAGKAPEHESGVGSRESAEDAQVLQAPENSPIVGAAAEVVREAPTAPQTAAPMTPETSPSLVGPVFAKRSVLPQAPSAKPPAWAKLSITLEPGDLDILDRFHASAREAGVKMRRGGNPSLFVRAALRAFDELGESQPEVWAERLAGVIAHDGA